MGESKPDMRKITVTHEEPPPAAPAPSEPEAQDMNAAFSWTTGFSLTMTGEKLPHG